MKKAAAILFLVIISYGCVKETNWPLPGKPLPQIVVDGVITDESKSQSIRITLPVTELNATPQPVTGADVVISNADSTWRLSENLQKPGFYMTSPTFLATLNKTYSLIIYMNDKIYSAKTYMVAGTAFNELQYVKNEGDTLYHIDWVANGFSYEKPAMWEILLDWSKVPGHSAADSSATHARLLFYTLPTLDVSEIFAPKVEEILFPAGTIITERRYSLTPEHAEFVREMLLETNWTGGFFSLDNSNVTTNMTNGAIGYFGACAVTSLSLTVTP